MLSSEVQDHLQYGPVLVLGCDCLLTFEIMGFIRKYDSIFYIGIAMVIFPYFLPYGKTEILGFHFQFPLNLTYTNTKLGIN